MCCLSKEYEINKSYFWNNEWYSRNRLICKYLVCLGLSRSHNKVQLYCPTKPTPQTDWTHHLTMKNNLDYCLRVYQEININSEARLLGLPYVLKIKISPGSECALSKPIYYVNPIHVNLYWLIIHIHVPMWTKTHWFINLHYYIDFVGNLNTWY